MFYKTKIRSIAPNAPAAAASAGVAIPAKIVPSTKHY